MKDNLQVENGGYVRIVNPLFDRLIQVQFKGCELNVALFIIRKTYGYNKTQDQISISQIMQGVCRSRQTVVTALKNLQLVNIVRLVKRGNSLMSSNVYSLNKYYETWELVNTARLVKRNRGTSLIEPPQLVNTARHTIDNTKDNTKDIAPKKENYLSLIENPTADFKMEMSKKYNCSMEEVRNMCDTILTWRDSDPSKHKIINYRATLMNWLNRQYKLRKIDPLILNPQINEIN